MKLLKLSIFFCVTLAFCSWNILSSEPNIEGGGEDTYKTYCKLCHGKKGSLGIGGAAKLTKSKLNLEERIEIITNGKGKMTPYGAILTEEEIKEVAKYTETFSK